jgi:Secretion system C-terminal sorting domain
MKSKNVRQLISLLLAIWTTSNTLTLAQIRYYQVQIDHLGAEFNIIGASSPSSIDVDMGPPRIIMQDTTINGKVREPREDFIWFDDLFNYVRSDTINLVKGKAVLSFAWEFRSFDLDSYLRPDSSLQIAYEIFDVDSGTIVSRAIETDIRRGASVVLDSLSGKWVTGYWVRGTRKQPFDARQGQRIITRMRMNTSALIDSTLLRPGLVVTNYSFYDSADYFAHYPFLAVDLPYGVTNASTEVRDLPDRKLSFSLEQCFPNPFNPSTTIGFSVPARSNVRLSIFNLLGQQVAELANEEVNEGYHERTWKANVASGFYFYRIEAVAVSDPQKRFLDAKKMLLLK